MFKKRQVSPVKDKHGRHLSHNQINADGIERHIELFNPTISHYQSEHDTSRLLLQVIYQEVQCIKTTLKNKCSYEVYRKVIKLGTRRV